MLLETDEVLYETEYLNLMRRDGWYYFAHVPSSLGGVAILLYRLDQPDKPILGRFERCPSHNDGVALTAIAGGIEKGNSPLTTARLEAHEEAGYWLSKAQLVPLGTTRLSNNQDTVVYLFAADVTSLEREVAMGDGSRGEVDAYCEWVTVEEAVFSKSAYLPTLLVRLKMRTGEAFV